MRQPPSALELGVFHKMYIAMAILATALLMLAMPRQVRAQNDAVRILAERVLRGSGSRDRWDDRDPWGSRSGEDRGRWEREQRAREAWCRKHRSDRRCDDLWGSNQRRGSDWCRDRNRDYRCDSSRRDDDRRRDRGRDSWWEDDDRTPRGRRGRR